MTTLTVAIATTATRLDRLHAARMPAQPGLSYHIFVQGDATVTQHTSLTRTDITITQTEGHGAARNRNAALEMVTSPLLLFADDDLAFDQNGLTALIDRFTHLPEIDFLCAQLSDETGRPRKRYSPNGQAVCWWNCAKVGTPELVLRPERFRAKGLAFDTKFGAGMPDYLGDEFIFLCDSLRSGMRGMHVDATPASHPTDSSGTTLDPAAMDIRKRVLIRALGPWKSRPARLAFALRHRRQFYSWRALWRFI